MRNLLLCLSAIVLVSCSHHPKNKRVAADTNTSLPLTLQLKNLDEIKLALLDAPYEKAEIILGKPDLRGKIMLGYFYYTVYFSKVNENGTIKHLVLLVDGHNGINDRSAIYKIVAVNDGGVVDRAGNYAYWLKISRSGLSSNSMDFNFGKGSLSWSDVDLGTGNMNSGSNVHVDTKIVNSLTELPIPSNAIKDTTIKKYIVTGLTGREIYLWYANNYHARLESNEESEHKFLYMPYYSPNDSCILLTMTGHLDGSVQLEFSLECGGD